MNWRDAEIGGNVGPGWEPLVDELHKLVQEIDPEIRVAQVKEKFGGLRYYYNLSAEYDNEPDPDNPWDETNAQKIRNLVSRAESASYWFCEVCGKVGHLRTDRFWIKTLCDEHALTGKNVPTMVQELEQE